MSAAPTTLATTDSADVAHEQAVTILHGDCLDVLRETLAAESVDAIVCDPPYGLGDEPPMLDVLAAWLAGEEWTPGNAGKGFMGKAWDAFVPGPAYWRACLRVLKPGGHLVAFGGTRTYDLISLAIRLAGFERRDTLAWIYGSGFPKSLDVSKAIDRLAGAERAIVRPIAAPRRNRDGTNALGGSWQDAPYITAPATDAARAWDGWGTALKPAYEPIILARKPIAAAAGSVAANVLRYGTGGVHVDACRVGATSSARKDPQNGRLVNAHMEMRPWMQRRIDDGLPLKGDFTGDQGRWPPNLLFSHAPDCDAEAGTCAAGCPVAALDAQSGTHRSRPSRNPGMPRAVITNGIPRNVYGRADEPGTITSYSYDDIGTASRYFPCFYYAPKASRSERDAGCEALPMHTAAEAVDREPDSAGMRSPRAGAGRTSGARNHHPTVKPLALMRWLVRLVTPAGGVVLDPFAGSGTTGVACVEEGMRAVLVEREAEYVPIIAARVAHAERTTPPAAPPLVRLPAAGASLPAPVKRKRPAAIPAGQLSLFAEAV